MQQKIIPLLMPKWGMDMHEGKIGEWLVSEGASVAASEDVLEIESEKVTNVLETSAGGTLERQLVNAGETHPVGTLLGLITCGDVSGDELTRFIADFQASAPLADPAETSATQMAEDIIEIEGQALHYTSAGVAGPVILLVHGFGGNLSSWGGVQDMLAASHRVLNVDLPGHGASTKQVIGGGSKELARLLIAFLDRLNIASVSLIGHSLGGAIASQIAALEPARVNSLILISSYGAGTSVDLNYIEEFVAASRRKEVKAVLKRLFLDTSIVGSDMVENLLKLKRIEGVDHALRTIADGIRAEQPDTPAVQLPEIPVQIILGRQDSIISFDQELLSDIENLVILEDAGHMPHLEKAAQTMSHIKRFLEAVGHTDGL